MYTPLPVTADRSSASLENGTSAANIIDRLRQVIWRKSLRKPVRLALDSGDLAAVVSAVRDWLPELSARKKSPSRALSGFVELFENPGWTESLINADVFPSGVASLGEGAELLRAVADGDWTAGSGRKSARPNAAAGELLLRYLADDVEIFGSECPPEEIQPLLCLRTLPLAAAFLSLQKVLPPGPFLEVWLTLRERAGILRGILDWPTGDRLPPLASLLVRGEFPCWLGTILACESEQTMLYEAGRRGSAAELDACTDTDGTPHGTLLPLLPAVVASFNRQATLAEQTGQKFLTAAGRQRWREFLSRCASLTDARGSLVLVDTRANHSWKSTLLDAIETLPERRELDWCQRTRSQLSDRGALRPQRRRDAVDQSAATQSDWGELACMRNNWYPGADLLAVAHSQPQMPLLLNVLAEPLLGGVWNTTVQVDGTPVALTEGWAALCWYNVEVCDYLELRFEAEGLRIDRQLFLSRTDHVALLADTVVSEVPGRAIELNWSLPVVSSWGAQASSGGRELLLRNGRQQVRCLPLTLPQSHVTRANGRCQLDGGQLQFDQTGQQNLVAALLLDFSPERRNEPCDWQQLTVTQERRILSPREAFAARARVGRHQWLYLKNLEYSRVPRAVLGQHNDAETLISEFLATGQAEHLVEVHYHDEQDPNRE